MIITPIKTALQDIIIIISDLGAINLLPRRLFRKEPYFLAGFSESWCVCELISHI